MLDKQTAIELAEGLGLKLKAHKNLHALEAISYFTFERMALLELEYNMIVGCGDNITAWAAGANWVHIPHDGTIDGKKAARMLAVAKVLIEIKRGEG